MMKIFPLNNTERYLHFAVPPYEPLQRQKCVVSLVCSSSESDFISTNKFCDEFRIMKRNLWVAIKDEKLLKSGNCPDHQTFCEFRKGRVPHQSNQFYNIASRRRNYLKYTLTNNTVMLFLFLFREYTVKL